MATMPPSHRVHEYSKGDPINSTRLLNAGTEQLNDIIRHWPWVLSQLRALTQRRLGNMLGRQGIWLAKITGNTSDSSNRWTYSGEEWTKNASGYDGFVKRTNGRTATAGQADALHNFIEEGNTGSGVEMNGVDHSGSSFTDTNFAMQPVPSGAFVVVYEISFYPTGDPLGQPTDPEHAMKTERWFQYENADDGTC